MPPRLALWMLRVRLSAEDREFAIGDLEEEFLDRVERDGRARARRWYWRQALRSLITRQPRRYQHAHTSPRTSAMNHFSQDIRFALRLLRRSPGFTAVVVLSLALGIGASTAMFTVVHAALLKPLPFKDPDRLVMAMNGPSASEAQPLNYPQLLQWRDEFKVFESQAGYFNSTSTISGDGDPEAVMTIRSTANLFSTLGVEPLVGRLFTQAEEAREAEPVVLLSESIWRRRYNADPNIQGRRIILNDLRHTIIGVLPGWFTRLRPADEPRELFVPLRVIVQTAPASLYFLGSIGAGAAAGGRASRQSRRPAAATDHRHPAARPAGLEFPRSTARASGSGRISAAYYLREPCEPAARQEHEPAARDRRTPGRRRRPASHRDAAPDRMSGALRRWRRDGHLCRLADRPHGRQSAGAG
jgi:hypothetical protein